MENGGKSITGVKLYKCGYCINNLRHVFRHHGREVREFPALVVLIRHRTLGNILYDSGYSELIYKNHLVSFLYNALNKTYVKETDTIAARLRADRVDPDSIHNIILSHAHPDHIGGLRLFRGYELISTQKVLDTLKNGNPFKLVFRNMIPDGDARCRAVVPFEGSTILDGYFDRIYDVLGDGSVLGMELSGHAAEQLGIYLPEYKLLFAADACWGADLLGKVKNMRFVAKRIQDNYRAYVRTAEQLERFVTDHPEITVIYSHGMMEETYYE